jgi:hypothetical protein
MCIATQGLELFLFVSLIVLAACLPVNLTVSHNTPIARFGAVCRPYDPQIACNPKIQSIPTNGQKGMTCNQKF